MIHSGLFPLIISPALPLVISNLHLNLSIEFLIGVIAFLNLELQYDYFLKFLFYSATILSFSLFALNNRKYSYFKVYV